MSNKRTPLPDKFSYNIDKQLSGKLRADHSKPIPLFVRIYDKELSLLRFVHGLSRNDLEMVRYALSQSEVSGTMSHQELSQITERLPTIYVRLRDKLGAENLRAMTQDGLPIDFVFEAIRNEFALHDSPETWGKYENSLMLAGDNIHKAQTDLGDAIRNDSFLAPLFDYLDDHPLIAPIVLGLILAAMLVNHILAAP